MGCIQSMWCVGTVKLRDTFLNLQLKLYDREIHVMQSDNRKSLRIFLQLIQFP